MKFKKMLAVILSVMMILGMGFIPVTASTNSVVKTTISKVESKAKGFKVTWKKQSKVKGYQIQYSTNSSFKNAKKVNITKVTTTSKTVSKLKGCNVKYYVRIRTYKTSGSKKYYSAWSKSKQVTTLKHDYAKATYKTPKKCKFCGKTSGSKLPSNSKGKTVYVTATGTKYHSTKNCRGLSRAKNIYSQSLASAKKAGLGACSICY